MQSNTTGLPNTDDYNIGRGRLLFSLLDTNDLPIAFRDLGNAPEFKITNTTTTLKHESSRQGLKVTDKEVTISQESAISYILDECNAENLAALFSGDLTAPTNAAIAGFTIQTMVGNGTIQLGRWYEIKNAAGARAYDVVAGNLTLATNAGSPVSLVLGTDYLVDSLNGLVFTIATSTKLATAISGTQGITAVLGANSAARTLTKVSGLTENTVVGWLKFISVNPANNDEETEFNFLKVSLSANGDFSLIGDTWTTMAFKATCAANNNVLYTGNPIFFAVSVNGQ